MESWGTNSDEELLQLCREGTRKVRNTAYTALWERHHQAGVRAAQRLAPRHDAEDLVSAAYLKIYEALSRGKGPRGAFRPYLYQVIKGVAADSYRPLEDTTDTLDTVPVALPEAPWEDESFDLDAASHAFASLQDRWQTVLWYTVVEELPPREVAKLMRLSANAVSALAIRAREALQSAWVEAHITSHRGSPDCEFALRHLERLHRGKLTARVKREVEGHLDVCPTCVRASSEIRTLNERLALIFTTIFVGGSGAALLSGLGHGDPSTPTNPTAQSASRVASQPGLSVSTRNAVGLSGRITGNAGSGSVAAVSSGPVLTSAGFLTAAMLVGITAAGGSLLVLRSDSPPPGGQSEQVSVSTQEELPSDAERRASTRNQTSSPESITSVTEHDDRTRVRFLFDTGADETDEDEPDDKRTDDDGHGNDTGGDNEDDDTGGTQDNDPDDGTGGTQDNDPDDGTGGTQDNDPDDGTGDSDPDSEDDEGEPNLEDASIMVGFDCVFDNGNPEALHPSGNSNQYGALQARLSGPGTAEAKLLIPPGNETVDDGRGTVFTNIFSGTDPDDPWWWWAPSVIPLTQWGEEFNGLGLDDALLELRLLVPDGRYSPWTSVDLFDSECS
ncbi:sigma-70 family RNA polymerase sigma factor [Leucobacter chromiireducens]|uniref:sigma-70 family RNA polymerase sigma factor n=1 Tax=Leucobacter chromiireducens TaxID=283877 RepID=UPI0031CEB4CC